VGNKVDLPQVVDEKDLRQLSTFSAKGGSASGGNFQLSTIKISATLGKGIDKLEERIYQMFIKAELQTVDTVLVTNLRHKEALIQTKEALLRAKMTTEEKLSEEFIALDLREALDSLGKIIGETVTEDILDSIFSQFCVGK